jgi:hypothetical protein
MLLVGGVLRAWLRVAVHHANLHRSRCICWTHARLRRERGALQGQRQRKQHDEQFSNAAHGQPFGRITAEYCAYQPPASDPAL